MATQKRKYPIIAQSEHDHENPADLDNLKKKSKSKTKTKIDRASTTFLSRWPGDVSNVPQRTTGKHKSKHSNLVTFSQLPDEIILMFLTYLNKSSIVAFGRTCRRYRSIAYHPTLWRRVDMSHKRLDSQQLISLLQRGTITLKMYQTTIEDASIFTTIKSCSLRHLDLTTAILSTDLLEKLVHSCQSLRKLSLESIALNSSIIEAVASNEQLDTLNLAMCTGITFESTQILIDRLTLLKSLNLAWTHLSLDTIQYLCEKMPRCLEQLNLSGQRYNLTDEHLQTLVRRVPRLRVLDISDALSITDQSIIAFRQHLRLLTHLAVSRCYLLTSTALIQLKLLPAFSTLDIFGTLAAFPMQQLRDEFGTRIRLNMFPISSVARPTTGIQRTSIWGLRTRI